MGKNSAARRAGYFDRFTLMMQKYPRILIVHADNVGSRQIAELRCQLRGKATIVMGKNTMIRTALKKLSETMPQVTNLIPEISLNMGLVFCEEDTAEVRKLIMANKVPAAARQGLIAPVDVTVPPGATGLDPSQTNWFQALGISTKIVKGQIEIQSPVELLKVGDKVTASQSVLLQKLNIRPFSYGLIPLKVYDDGSVYDAKVLDMTDDDIIAKFRQGADYVAALSREIGMPTQPSTTHSIIEAFKNCVALCLEAGDYDFPQMTKIRKMIENPGAFAAAAPAAAAPAPAAAAAKKAPEPESEESDDDMGLGMFD